MTKGVSPETEVFNADTGKYEPAGADARLIQRMPDGTFVLRAECTCRGDESGVVECVRPVTYTGGVMCRLERKDGVLRTVAYENACADGASAICWDGTMESAKKARRLMFPSFVSLGFDGELYVSTNTRRYTVHRGEWLIRFPNCIRVASEFRFEQDTAGSC